MESGQRNDLTIGDRKIKRLITYQNQKVIFLHFVSTNTQTIWIGFFCLLLLLLFNLYISGIPYHIRQNHLEFGLDID